MSESIVPSWLVGKRSTSRDRTGVIWMRGPLIKAFFRLTPDEGEEHVITGIHCGLHRFPPVLCNENLQSLYLAVRYPAIYATAAEAFGRNSSLTAVDVQTSPLSSTRKVVDVIFSFTNRATDVVEKFFTRVDVTEEFPFLVTKMSPYFDR